MNKSKVLYSKEMLLPANSRKTFEMLGNGLNRSVENGHVNVLIKSLTKDIGEITRCVLIALVDFLPGGPKYYIIDGQHLYTACKTLKIDIPYRILSTKIKNTEHLIRIITTLNSSAKNWRLSMYIDAWSYERNDYKIAKELISEFKFEIQIICTLLHHGIITGSSSVGKNSIISGIIKRGDLEVKYLKKTRIILERVQRICNDLDFELQRSELAYLISTMAEKIDRDGDTYNHNRYIKYLISIKDQLKIAGKDVKALRQLLNN